MHEEEVLRNKIKELDSVIDSLRKEKKSLQIQIRRLGYRTNNQRTGAEDPYVVDISSTVESFKLWMDSFEGSTSPLRSLSEKSGVSVKTISEIMHGRRIWVTFDTADRLLTAIGGGWLINDLPQKRNPVGMARKPESQFYEE